MFINYHHSYQHHHDQLRRKPKKTILFVFLTVSIMNETTLTPLGTMVTTPTLVNVHSNSSDLPWCPELRDEGQDEAYKQFYKNAQVPLESVELHLVTGSKKVVMTLRLLPETGYISPRDYTD